MSNAFLISHFSFLISDNVRFGGLAQLARAPALQAGGQRFESVILHKVDISDYSDNSDNSDYSDYSDNSDYSGISYPPEIFDILTQARL